MTVKALESAGFCKAWTALQTAWNTWNPKGNAKTKMEEEFFRSLKFYANEPKMLFYVGSTFNGDVRLTEIRCFIFLIKYSVVFTETNIHIQFLGWPTSPLLS